MLRGALLGPWPCRLPETGQGEAINQGQGSTWQQGVARGCFRADPLIENELYNCLDRNGRRP